MSDEGKSEDIVARIQMFGARLSSLSSKLVQKRHVIEQRWLEDLRQYEGRYSEKEESNMRKGGGSQVFVNITRSKVHAAEARLGDMLFPTDDRNWSIDPTPVPGLSEKQNSNEVAGYGQDGQAIGVADLAKEEIDRAKKAAKAMQVEIDDQLKEGRYNEICRDVIHDACLLGTGVLKAPVIVGASRKAWKQEDDGEFYLSTVDEHRPIVERIDPWDFFPDMEGRKLSECEFIMQRHWLTGREVFELRDRPGFIEDQVEGLLKSGASKSPTMDAQLTRKREIAGGSTDVDYNRYEVWEYHGSITRDELIACGCEDLEEGMEHALEAIVWFSGNFILKAVINPAETGSRPYSVYNWIEDDTSVFGKGISTQIRSQQRVCNAAWRMVMDDANSSIGTQLVVDEDAIEPENGSWNMTGRKVWRKIDPTKDVRQAFASFDVPSHQGELMNIYSSARQMIDDETGMPTIAEGDQVGAGAQTMGGMAMMMNASLVVLRRAVKNFDDSITVPTIKRFYDWNMQFSRKQVIKGDFEIDARGSSALLTKELQAQSLMQLMQFAAHPVFGSMTKAADLYRKAVQAHQISPNDIIYTDEEIEQRQQQEQQAMAQQQQAEQDNGQAGDMKVQMEQQKLEMQYRMHQEKLISAQAERESELQERMIEREIAMIRMSGDQNIAIEKINADLTRVRENNNAEWQRMLAEIETKSRFGSGI